jgi:hypothetical protein
MTRNPPRLALAGAALAALSLAAGACSKSGGGAATDVKLARTIALPGVDGRLGPILLDRDRDRLYIAAPDRRSIEIVDVKEGKPWKSHPNVGDPSGFAFVAGATPSQDTVVAALGSSKLLWICDAEKGESPRNVELDGPAGCLRYHDATSRLYVGRGEGASGGLTVLEVNGWKREVEIPLAGAPASFQLESQGKKIFVNVPSADHIAVANRDSRSVVDKYALQNVKGNYAMAFDERIARLFVACREPASFLVVDTRAGDNRGDLVGSFPCSADPGDLHCDLAKDRVYVSCGEGFVDVFEHRRPDTYVRMGRVETRVGAKASFFVPAQRRLYVVLPKQGDAPAEVRILEVP